MQGAEKGHRICKLNRRVPRSCTHNPSAFCFAKATSLYTREASAERRSWVSVIPRCRKIRLKWRNRIETCFDSTRSRTMCTASGEVHSFEPIFQTVVQGAKKGHRIRKLNRRVTRSCTSVQREVKFADSKKHFNQNCWKQFSPYKTKNIGNPMLFAVYVLFQSFGVAEYISTIKSGW